MAVLSRLRNVFRTGRVEHDLDDELQFHLDQRIDELIKAGRDRETARREAASHLGHHLQLREQSRDVKIIPWLDSLVRDTRLAVRRLWRDATVSGAAILSLGLALGACLAAFTLVDALVLRPLPVQQPDRLVFLSFPSEAVDPVQTDRFNFPLFERLRDAARDQVELFGMSTQVLRPAVFDGQTGAREMVRTQYVSGDAFARLGILPAAGRLLAPDDDRQPGVSPAVVLSHSFWMRRFGGDEAAIGRWFTLEGKTLKIVGVAEPRFTGVEPGRPTDVWLPTMMYTARAFADPTFNWFRTFGRLRSTASVASATGAVQAAFTGYRRERAERLIGIRSPEAIARFIDAPIDLRSAANGPSPLRQQFERPLWILAATALLVLLIAGSNVANLFLARSAARTREMSLRLSIGASRLRLVQQTMLESALIAGLAGVLGVYLSRIAASTVVGMLTSDGDPVALSLGADIRFAIATAGTLACSTILFGLAPALRASRTAPMVGLHSGGRGASRVVALRPFVGIQVGFSLVVLFVSGLLVLSFTHLSRTSPGFDASNVQLFSLETTESVDAVTQRAVIFQVLDRLRSTSGVDSVSLTENHLLGRTWTMTARVPETAHDTIEVTLAPVADQFFETMRIPLREGRTFTAADMNLDRSPALVVNEAFARLYGRGKGVIGQSVDGPFGGSPGASKARRGEIVGVVGDTRYDLREDAAPMVYLPVRARAMIVARTSTSTDATERRLRYEIQAASPLLRVTGMTPLSTTIEDTLVRERLLALLSGFFAATGLLLAGVGLYGVLSYSVVERTREIGIRVALGARPWGVVRTLLAGIVPVALLGAACGLGAGVYLSRFIEAVLFGVTALDPWSIALPLTALLATAVAAVILPAWRAARVDPVIALRHE